MKFSERRALGLFRSGRGIIPLRPEEPNSKNQEPNSKPEIGSWKLVLGNCFPLGLMVSLLVGCAAGPERFDQALMADSGAAGRNQGVAQAYHVFCPDVLETQLQSAEETVGVSSEYAGIRRVSTAVGSSHSIPEKVAYRIEPDGCIDLGPRGKLRVEGRTPSQVANLLSEEFRISADRIQVRVAEYNSQQIYLFGQVMPRRQKDIGGGTKGETGQDLSQSPNVLHPSPFIPSPSSQRAVPYQGPESVLDMLQRVGGITPGAAPNDVHVVRSRLADNLPPEVFNIDLRAIVTSQDQSTNLRLQPFDQVFVGETNRSSLEKCLPPCLRPMYEKLCGMWRPGSFSYGDPLPVQTLKANITARSSPSPPTTYRGSGSSD
jgi:protein involved in polysaccharide export with SLBB domain